VQLTFIGEVNSGEVLALDKILLRSLGKVSSADVPVKELPPSSENRASKSITDK
jgi:hypothetical protein